jgi:hypothetical protein
MRRRRPSGTLKRSLTAAALRRSSITTRRYWRDAPTGIKEILIGSPRKSRRAGRLAPRSHLFMHFVQEPRCCDGGDTHEAGFSFSAALNSAK